MANRKKTELPYSQASAELETILDEIEDGTADIDVLSQKVERAAELIRMCRETLSGTELRINRIVEELAAAAPAAAPDDDGDEE